MTRTRQLSTLGQGLAAGCLELGHESFRAEWFGLEGGMRRAMGQWRHRGLFRSVKLGMSPNDLRRQVIGASESRVGRLAAWLPDRGVLEPYIVQDDWTPLDVAEVLATDADGVTLGDWVDLSREWLSEARVLEQP